MATARALDLLITPDLIDQNAAGQVVYWRLHGPVSLQRLTDAWSAAGLPPEQLPATPSPEVALRRAVDNLAGRRRLVRPLARRGAWAVITEHCDKVTNALSYTTDLTVRQQRTTIVIEPADHPDAARILEAQKTYEQVLLPTDISAWLIRRAEALRAVLLREGGGVYFIPREHVSTWRRICDVVEMVTQHKVFRIPAMHNSEAAAAILDAVVTEAETVIAKLCEELQTKHEDEQLGRRAIQSRQKLCEAAVDKIAFYEKLLGTRMEGLRTQFRELEINLTAATLATSN